MTERELVVCFWDHYGAAGQSYPLQGYFDPKDEGVSCVQKVQDVTQRYVDVLARSLLSSKFHLLEQDRIPINARFREK